MPLQFNLTKFAVALKIWREMHGFSQREVAEMTGLAPGTISRLESDEFAPDLASFAKICDLIGFQPNDFFTQIKGE
jgi:transcriptional regulator with XRE-family HTH domain